MSESINNPGEAGEPSEVVHTVEEIQALRAQAEREANVNGNQLNEVSGAMAHSREQKEQAEAAARAKMAAAYEANPNKIGPAPAWPQTAELAAPKPVIDVPTWTQQ
jgi:hypothetical protein